MTTPVVLNMHTNMLFYLQKPMKRIYKNYDDATFSKDFPDLISRMSLAHPAAFDLAFSDKILSMFEAEFPRILPDLKTSEVIPLVFALPDDIASRIAFLASMEVCDDLLLLQLVVALNRINYDLKQPVS